MTRERPILFSAPMVRALLAGAKTQTRRLYKPRYPDPYEGVEDGAPWRCGEDGIYYAAPCPYGERGDRLWVKETFAYGKTTVYRADDPSLQITWTSSLFMRRALSRITLEVTAVRFQRLQDISEADAQAEGAIHAIDEEWSVLPEPKRPAHGCVACSGDPRGISELCHDSVSGKGRPWACHYALLWDHINGAGGWAQNPWVWAITFEAPRG